MTACWLVFILYCSSLYIKGSSVHFYRFPSNSLNRIVLQRRVINLVTFWKKKYLEKMFTWLAHCCHKHDQCCQISREKQASRPLKTSSKQATSLFGVKKRKKKKRDRLLHFTLTQISPWIQKCHCVYFCFYMLWSFFVLVPGLQINMMLCLCLFFNVMLCQRCVCGPVRFRHINHLVRASEKIVLCLKIPVVVATKTAEKEPDV